MQRELQYSTPLNCICALSVSPVDGTLILSFSLCIRFEGVRREMRPRATVPVSTRTVPLRFDRIGQRS